MLELREIEKGRKLLEQLRRIHEATKASPEFPKGRYTNVPVALITESIKEKNLPALIDLIRLKLLHGHSVPKNDVKRWRRLVRLGWVRASKDRIHPFPWSRWHTHKVNEGKEGVRKGTGCTTVIFPEAWLPQGTDAIFLIVQAWMLRIQTQKPVRSNEESKNPVGSPVSGDAQPGAAHVTRRVRKAKTTKKRLLQSSEHTGGVSLSLLAEAFNKTKSWASQMRRKMEKWGACQYTRRYEFVTKEEVESANLSGYGHLYRYHVALARWVKEIVSLCSSSIVPVFRWRATCVSVI